MKKIKNSQVLYLINSTIFCVIIIVSLIFVKELNEIASPFFPKQPLSVRGYHKNPHTEQKTWIADGKYHYSYKFKDNKNKLLTWTWSYEKDTTDKAIARFGVPKSIFEPYYATTAVIAKRKMQMKSGMFVQKGGYVLPNKSQMVKYYAHFVKPIYDLYNKECIKNKYNSRDCIQLLMSFCQDIPYGIPPNEYNNKIVGGIFPPPLALNNMWADCDTKSVIFSSILVHAKKYQIAFFEVPGHLFMGIREIPRPYDKFVTHRGVKYVVCEPVGPGHLLLGKSGKNYSHITNIELLNVNITLK